MCKKHSHNNNLISCIHSNAEREFSFDGNSTVCDDENVRAKRAELIDGNLQSLIALGDALAYQMRYNEALVCYLKARDLFPDDYTAHRKCAIRLMSVLRTDDAEREFLWCKERTEDELDIAYRLALCAYYKGDYALAEEKLLNCYQLCRNNGEMYVAVLYWHIQCLVRLRKNVDEALSYYYDGLDGGHHIGYMQTVKLFLSDSIVFQSDIDDDDELNLSIYRYGYYAYLLNKGYKPKAVCELDEMLKLNTYFSSFAYLGAYSEKLRLRNDAIERLNAFFKDNPKIAVAFSGGTDSALLLSLAKDAGADVKAYFIKSQFQPEFEVEDAIKLARELSVECEFIEADVLSDENIAVNGKDRCYYCKHRIFDTLIRKAERDGYYIIADGTNASDDAADRPGMRVLREFGVRSPLRECGLTKADVRQISRERGLFTWNKPSYSCLATRINTRERISAESLLKIEKAETALFEKGYINFRVRYSDRCAKIEVDKAQNEKFQMEKEQIFKELSAYFDKVEQSEFLR